MRYLLAALLAASPAVADDLMLKGERGHYARLQDKPCANELILSHIRDEFKHAFRAGIVGTPDATIPMCWIEMQGQVLVSFEDGSHIQLPASGFKRSVGL